MPILQAWLWPFVTIPLTSAVLVNRTVDDTFRDGQGTTIQYLPEGAWNDADCSKCVAKPTPSLVYDQTWHDGQYLGKGDPLTASLTFNGTALYVYTVLVKVFPNGHVPNCNLSFYLDGEVVGTFFENGSDLDALYQYNASVYVNENLPYKTHIFSLVNGGVGSLVLLDKMMYTYEDGLSANTTDQNSSSALVSATSPDPVATDALPASHSSNSGIPSRTLAAAIATPLAVLFFCGVGLFWFWRRRVQSKRLKRSSHLTLDPQESNFGGAYGDIREAAGFNAVSGSDPGRYQRWDGNRTRPGGLSDFVVEPFVLGSLSTQPSPSNDSKNAQGSSPDLSWGKRSQPQLQPQPQLTQFSPSLSPDADTHVPMTMTSLEVASSLDAPPSYHTRQ
ncbi:hypothetical protein D9758_017153 [Tetrapyrgos nigripes]|uniref:Uncharacterized protein n=1 Tax=Tetrapyrgos nigripes TaxID=182062 RepID=A0A8H5BT94_9AGAR|nr:hypothetical protein D9758_017153 [Tetrapyrgos nigripes]